MKFRLTHAIECVVLAERLSQRAELCLKRGQRPGTKKSARALVALLAKLLICCDIARVAVGVTIDNTMLFGSCLRCEGAS